LARKAQREKLAKEKRRFRISLVATSDQGSAFGNRKPLKRLERNFPATLHLSLDLTLHNKNPRFLGADEASEKATSKNSKTSELYQTSENEAKLL
jgi:hypothetical protein